MDSLIHEIEHQSTKLINLILPFLKNIKLITLLSILLQFVSIALVLLLPSFGSQTYVSEKNLQCTVSPFISNNFAEKSINYSNIFSENFPNRSLGSNEALESANWIKNQLDTIGLDTQLHFFNSSFDRVGVNVVGIVKATKSLGTECFVLTTSFDQWHSKGAVGFLIGFAEYMKNTTWQARDLIFLFTSEGGEMNGGTSMDISGSSVWIHDYFSSPPPIKNNFSRKTSRDKHQIGWIKDNKVFKRGGKIYGAIALNRVGNQEMEKIIVYPEGLKGGLSNLDIINTVTTTTFLNEIPAGINSHMVDEPVEGSIYGLLVFMWNSALSLPRSNHAIFTKYGINSVGISTDSSHNVWDIDFLNTPLHKVHNFKNEYKQPLSNSTFLNLGKIMETVVRHLHNADEQLHQSYTWYVMAGAVFFIDIGQALLPTIVLVVSMGVQFLSFILTVDNLPIRVISAMPEFFSTITFCFLLYLLPTILTYIGFIPSNDLKLFVFIIYILILTPVSKYIKNIVISKYPILTYDWYGLQSLLLLHYSLVSLMCMMLNNQFACLFMIFSLPTIQFTGFLMECSIRSKIIKFLWLLVCLFSHPVFLFFEWWSIWSVGWKNLFSGVLIASNNWGFLFYPIFTLCLLPIFISIFKLLFITNCYNTKQKFKNF
ncbi:hypothetical protein DICPUDRAFT_82192 [Dictyostelium purpureum]|uniref:Uncharacterized protein n=1 Tax=Dictyostelium purpureum TaxID=5786 RepID=F0ZVT0_DICPU|nr:uncharacterized protein DICPUDRAFT_82192 [Dictyostelium purpureum]EGC31957.1 hypothetical protein DICPUDRAFT_82192 [Dictyostelium purpureum]|eukprot:XP_003291526.1 hypothetical protein DICPUDRAFT_82192 [Dictyostelium purpureum]